MPATTRIPWPNLLTAARVVLVVPVVALTLKRTDASSWLAFAAFAVAAVTDGLDGYLARRLDLVSAGGQLWDPIADKVLVTASMAALVVVERFPLWAAGVIVAREVAVMVLRWAAVRRGRGFSPSIAGKAKTGAQLVAVLLFLLPLRGAWERAGTGILWLAVVLTVVSGLDYLLRARRLLERAPG